MKELEDRSWFPTTLRDFQTDFIGFLAARGHLYDRLLAYWRSVSALRQPQVDLCSGSGQPAINLYRRSDSFTHLTLTDLYPHRGISAPHGVEAYPYPVDARTLPLESGTCYTMFNALHHFTEGEQLGLVRRLRDRGAEAYLVEILEPTVLCMVKVLLATTVGVLLFTPFVRPFRWDRLLFTYFIPINIITITWDGVLSVLRSSTAKRYAQLLTDEGSAISIHRLRGRWMPLTLLHIQRGMIAPRALVRFSRPHTMVGSVVSISTLYAIVVSRAEGPHPLLLASALVVGISCNLFIVGLNQLADVEVDRINKPWLPLPAGTLTRKQAWAIVLSSLAICLGVALWVSPYLFLLVAMAATIGWAYSMPPLHLKRHHLSAALAITAVRGVLVNLGGFIVYDHLVNGVVYIPLNVWILTAFIVAFSITIAWFKDLPDVAGDARFHIRTLPVITSPRAALVAGHLLVGTAYLFTIFFLCLRPSTNAVDALRTRVLVHGHIWLLLLFASNATALRLDRGEVPVRRFYLRFWWFFFAEYALYLVAYLLPR